MKKCLFFIFWAMLTMFAVSACNDGDDGRNDKNNTMTFVSEWNEIALAAVRSGSARPTVTTRQMFLLSAAMYDAWTAYDPVARPYLLDSSLHRPSNEHTEKNQKQAVSLAAYTVLIDQFPEYEASTHAFSDHMKQLGYSINPGLDEETPEGIGVLAGQAVLKGHENDGSNWQNAYADTTCPVYPELYQPLNSPVPGDSHAVNGDLFDMNAWTPLRVPTGVMTDEEGKPVADNNDPATYRDQSFLTPHWGSVTPFALTSGDEFRPEPRPNANRSSPIPTPSGIR